MSDVKAFTLYRRVSVEGHVKSVAGGHYRVGQSAAAQTTKLTSTHVISVEDLQTVVRALHVRLQLKVIERLRATICL